MSANTYLMDTNAIIRHFCGLPNLGKKATAVIKDAEAGSGDVLIISIVSLMEIMYLAEKNRIKISLKEAIKSIEAKSCYLVVALDTEMLKTAEKITFYELHDRLILGTAKYYGATILSSDKLFAKVKDIKVVW